MPEPTTRAGRYEYRRKRYARKLKRRRWSYPYVQYPGTAYEKINHADGPYVFAGDGTRQQRLADQIVKPEHGPFPHPPPITDHHITPVSYQHPPHVHINYTAPPRPSHTNEAEINYHHRAQTYRGKKLDKHKGIDFVGCRSWWWSDYYFRSTGVRKWPPWDPYGRTPVWVDWPEL